MSCLAFDPTPQFFVVNFRYYQLSGFIAHEYYHIARYLRQNSEILSPYICDTCDTCDTCDSPYTCDSVTPVTIE